MTQRSRELAVGWIEAWKTFDMDWLRRNLSPDFVHVSPFGRLEGREFYLATVEPMARKSVAELTVREVVAEGDTAVIRFDNRTEKGVVESCDWVHVAEGAIREIRSFYDTSTIRQVLSSDEQQSLEG